MAQERDDLTPLAESLHMLEWLNETPLVAIRSSFEGWVDGRVPGSEVLCLAVEGKPELLTGGVPIEGEEGKIRLARVGVAFCFRVEIQSPDGEQHLVVGIFTWVGRELHTKGATQQIWIDVNGSLDDFGSGGALRERIF